MKSIISIYNFEIVDSNFLYQFLVCLQLLLHIISSHNLLHFYQLFAFLFGFIALSKLFVPSVYLTIQLSNSSCEYLYNYKYSLKFEVRVLVHSNVVRNQPSMPIEMTSESCVLSVSARGLASLRGLYEHT